MRPQIIIKTSFPFQRYMLNDHYDDESMEELRDYRDQLIDTLSSHVTFLDHMEDSSGMSFQEFTLDVWVIKGRDTRISSPLMLPVRDSTAASFLELAHLIAKEILYQNRPSYDQSDHLEPGDDGIGVTAAMLAYRSVKEAAGEDYVEKALGHNVFDEERSAVWQPAKEHEAAWDDEPLTAHLGLERSEQESMD